MSNSSSHSSQSYTTSQRSPKLLERVRLVLRRKHDSYRTEQAYVHWIRRNILFHKKRYLKEMSM